MPQIDLPFDPAVLQLHVLARLLTAAVLGAAIGLERQIKGKEAGLRTHILICLGAALLTVMSVEIVAPYARAYHTGDVGRIASNIATGVGFLGGGAIMQARGRVRGLTTAATIWIVAAIGMAAGAGAYVPAVGTTVLVVVILLPLGAWERRYVSRLRSRARMHVLTEREKEE